MPNASSSVASEDTPARLARLRGYAWNYFAFHAEQRMKTFHFYLLLVAAISAALITLRTKTGSDTWATESVLYFLVGFVSLMFYLLDRRNRELVRNGEAALRYLDGMEAHERPDGHPHALELFARDHHVTSQKPPMPSLEAHYSYAKILGVIFLVFGLSGAVGGIARLVSICWH